MSAVDDVRKAYYYHELEAVGLRIAARLDALEPLAAEVREIAVDGTLPDGDSVNVPTRLWAAGWARK